MNIENKRQLATILLAVGLGLVAAMLMSKVVSDKVEEQTNALSKEYQRNSSALLNEMDVAKKTIQQLSQKHDALAKKVAQQPLVQPQIIREIEKPTVQQTAFSLRTPPGKRALTIEIEPLSAVGGLVNPGDFVDIIAHLNVSEEDEDRSKKKKPQDKETVTTVLFQNIQVLAVGINYDPVGVEPAYEAQQKAKSLNVTLAVSPEEAGLLTFAQTKGELQLSLRSPAEQADKVLQRVASWDALSEFVLEHQGTELLIPKKKAESVKEPEKIEEEVKTYIPIYRGGREQ